MPRSILLIDDEPSILHVHSRYFRGEGWEVYRAMAGEDGLQLYASHEPDVVLLDLNLPGLPGFEVLKQLVARNATVILLTAYGEVENAVRAMKLGAENFVTKPAKLPHLNALVQKAAEKAELRRTNRYMAEHFMEFGTEGLGPSQRMRALARQVEVLARSGDTAVLLTGESGTGKGWIASLIHGRGGRAAGPFLEISCAGLPAAVLDSELFGHEKGALTDSKTMRRGLYEAASGGTLFVDEIDALAPALQPKLLKAIETRTFRRLGGTVDHPADVRLIAATSRDLRQEITAGRFREDLFARLNVLPLHVPAVRERATEDVLALIQSLMNDLAKQHPRGAPGMSDAVLAMLVRYDWPGNVRQMRDTIEYALIMSAGQDEIVPAHLPSDVRAPPGDQGSQQYTALTLEEVERRHIEQVLLAFGGNRSQAASALGISRGTLYKKIREYGIGSLGRSGEGDAGEPPQSSGAGRGATGNPQ